MQDNTYFKSVEEGVKAPHVEAKADIVVICAVGRRLRDARSRSSHKLLGDKAIFVVAGAPACKEELEAQGIKNFIQRPVDNVLETLQYYLKELGI